MDFGVTRLDSALIIDHEATIESLVARPRHSDRADLNPNVVRLGELADRIQERVLVFRRFRRIVETA